MNEQLLPHASHFPEANVGCARIERGESTYPLELEALGENAPPYLWTRGSLELLDVRPRVAIVGTRRATAYGQRVTRELTLAFVRAGACIVSGLATGIDGTAHRTAIESNGTSRSRRWSSET